MLPNILFREAPRSVLDRMPDFGWAINPQRRGLEPSRPIEVDPKACSGGKPNTRPWRHGDTATRRHGDTATLGALGLRSEHLGRLFAPQMAAKTSVSRYWAVSPLLSPSANIQAQQPPVSLEPGRPTQQDRAAGEARSFPEGLGNDVGLFLGRGSHPAGDMATVATRFFVSGRWRAARSPVRHRRVEPRNTPLSPLRGEGGFLPRPIWGDQAEFASVRAAQLR